MRAHANDLCNDPYFQIRSHSEVPGIRTSTYLSWVGVTIQPVTLDLSKESWGHASFLNKGNSNRSYLWEVGIGQEGGEKEKLSTPLLLIRHL